MAESEKAQNFNLLFYNRHITTMEGTPGERNSDEEMGDGTPLGNQGDEMDIVESKESSRKREKRRERERSRSRERNERSHPAILYRADAEGWVLNPGTGAILHPRNCQACTDYASHYGTAMMMMDKSLTDAVYERGGELRNALRNAEEWRRDFNEERDVAVRAEKRLAAAKAEIAELKEKLEMEQAKLLSLNAEIEQVSRKRPRLHSPMSYEAGPSSSLMSGPPSTMSGPTSIPRSPQRAASMSTYNPMGGNPYENKDEEYDSGEDSPSEDELKKKKKASDRAERKRSKIMYESKKAVEKLTPSQREEYMISPYVSKVDNTYRMGEEARKARENEMKGLPPPRGMAPRAHPRVPQWEPRNIDDVASKIREAQIPGNQTGYLQMKGFAAASHKTSADLRNEMQWKAVRDWANPIWVSPELRNIHREEYARRPPPSTKFKLPALKMPKVTDSPEEWAEWLLRNGHGINARPGIGRTEGGINLRTVRGMLLVNRRAPLRVKGEPERNTRAQFTHVLIELMATRNGYRDAVTRLELNIAQDERPGRFEGAIANVTEDDVVRFLAEHGVSFDQMADGWLYATGWLRDSAAGFHAMEIAERMARVERRSTGRPASSTLPMPGTHEWWYPVVGPTSVEGGQQAGIPRTVPGRTYPPHLSRAQVIQAESTVLGEAQVPPASINTLGQQTWSTPGGEAAPGARAVAAMGTTATAASAAAAAGASANNTRAAPASAAELTQPLQSGSATYAPQFQVESMIQNRENMETDE